LNSSDAMIEPLLGLAVALALGVYLLFTLFYPERF
jgi:K+-transporting ATPase KdpF subunit